jgi:arginyl-tRNA synthetase
MLIEELRQAVKDACRGSFNEAVEPEITRPDEKFGDYSTNAALQLAKQAAATPRQIAEKLVEQLKDLPGIKEISIAGPGFINFRLTDEALANAAHAAAEVPMPNSGKQILVEFGDPNPFKEMHIGHLYSYIVGDAISSLLEASGADVKRLSYHGDVGRQVAQAIWGMQHMEVSDDTSLGQAYAKGAQAYEEDEQAKSEIDAINRHVYEQDDQRVNELHQKGVKLSFEHFDKILNMLSIPYDKRYLESQTTPVGLKMVQENTGKVFTESDGAVVYKGEEEGLHTRVFITSQGLPTYETKDLGLVELKHQDFPDADRSIVITASEQAEYFKVMLAALARIKPELAQRTKHLSHGFLSLSTGKMSSRTGKVYSAVELINDVKENTLKLYPDAKGSTQLAAIKYGLLKQRLGSDIVFDVEESVSIEGNSGPYLQYAHARACSILAKAGQAAAPAAGTELDNNERSLARKVSEFPEVVAKAVNELMPHHICTYLYELAQVFNAFYETSRIIGDERETIRLGQTKDYQQVLQKGLGLLNITAPEKM